MSDKKTDYVAEGLDRMLEQFHGSVKLRALASAFLQRVQDFEDAYHPLLAERSLDNATGDRLDILGQIVKQLRSGRNDADYRLALQAEFAIIRSTGTAEELLTIAQLLIQMPTADYEFIEYYPKTIYMRPVDHVLTQNPTYIGSALRRVVSAATEFLFVYSLQGDATTYTLSSLPDTEEVDAARGLGDEAQTTGGFLAGAA